MIMKNLSIILIVALSVAMSALASKASEAESSVSLSVPPASNVDIDGNEKFDALTDGLLILRSMFGLTGDSLTSSAVADDALYKSAEEIESRITSLGVRIDVDNNGRVDALTDGLIILRYLFGLSGDTLTNGVLASDAERVTIEDIESHMERLSSFNQAPIFTSGAIFSVAENQLSIGTVSATDLDSESITFTVSGTEFAMTSAGVLSFKVAPDYETKATYTATVTASDGTNTATQDITVSVTDANDTAPVFTSGATFSAAENQLSIGTVSATDVDSEFISFTVSGTELAMTSAGVLSFKVAPDYETKATYTATVTASDGTNTATQSIIISLIDVFEGWLNTWYGTKTPSFLASPPESYTIFDPSDNLNINGQLEGLNHEPTDAPGAGKLIFNRVYRAFKHGLQWGEQFGIFGSWLGSYGANSIEGGLWANPKTAGPYYYPTLHLAGVGDTYHRCSDVQMGSGMYERIIGDKWLNMIQISNKVLTIPGSNIAFDMEQNPYDEDNGIWVGWGWSYLNLDHPRGYKFWMSFIESYDYQGPINGYIPEYFNWVDPEKVDDGRYADKLLEYGSNYGTFATKGSKANSGNGNENYVNGLLRIEEDLFYVPLPNLPIYKEREYLVAHPQNVSQSAMENYSASIKNNTLEETLINSSNKTFESIYESTHNQLKITEQIDGEEHRYMVVPSYQIGFENNLGYVQWDFSDEATKQTQIDQNGYGYVRKLDAKWVVEDGASDDYKNHPNQYQTELVDAPDDIIRAPKKSHKFFSYKERDTSNEEFSNWEIGSRTRYEKTLQNGATVTYVWFKFIEQPAMLSAKQNHPETYTDEYLNNLQAYIERFHTLINSNSKQNPSKPVFINYKGANNPDNKDPHLSKIDAGQIADTVSGFEIGYVPLVISVYHPEEYSENGVGLESAPHSECNNADWTDTFHPDI
jgi:hypothetical protein